MAEEWEETECTGKSFAKENYEGKFGGGRNDSDQDKNGWNDNSGGWSAAPDDEDTGNSRNNSYGGGSDRDQGGRGPRGRGGFMNRGRGRGGGGYNRDNNRNDNNYSNGDGNGENGDYGGRPSGGRGRGGFRGGNRDGGGGGRDGGRDRRDRDRDGSQERGDRGHSRGGGGRGRGRGGYMNGDGDRNNSRDEDKVNNEKPREFYIPPEPENEEELFNQGISSGINFDKYDKIPVNVSTGAPPAISTFEDSGLNKYLLNNVSKSGYSKPTPIQKHSIPIIMAGRDLMACAQTGSGKTAAFLLPILHDILENQRDVQMGRPHVLIVSPTRELSIQIFQEARKFAAGSYVQIQIVYGGTAVKHQGNNIAKGLHVLVCTPGRLLDFVEKGKISFEDIKYVVLDEADRMLDLGFMPSVEKVMNHPSMPQERNTLMFSATFPEAIQRLAGQFLDNYVFLAVGIVGSACTDVQQNFYKVTKFEKKNKLLEILEQGEVEGTMVFVETKRNTDFLASFLSETQFPTTSIHGDRLQREREEALRDFKTGKMKILIATSVAARGLDIKNVAHVINYDMPKSIDEYVHRIGRTGRVGNCGKATSFYDPTADGAIVPDLVKILQQANQPVPNFLNTGENEIWTYNNGPRHSFGSRDVRRNQKSKVHIDEDMGQLNINSVPEAQEPEEEW